MRAFFRFGFRPIWERHQVVPNQTGSVLLGKRFIKNPVPADAVACRVEREPHHLLLGSDHARDRRIGPVNCFVPEDKVGPPQIDIPGVVDDGLSTMVYGASTQGAATRRWTR
jgi:hypothetical protein